MPGLSRRRLITSGAGAALGAAALTACGGDDGETGGGAGAAGNGTSKTSDPGNGGQDPPSGAELVALADVPVGEAVSAEDKDGEPIIVSRPTEAEVVAFSAICTHMGCTVAPDGDILRCPCHGSTYDLATGDNTGGPAPEPLAALSVSVRDGMVVQS
jgi:Rieske Fe-S protein